MWFGLFPDEQYEVVKKLELVKDNYYNDLSIDYSLVNGCDNWVSVKNDVPLNIGIQLFEMFKQINFNSINAENRIIPNVTLVLRYNK